MQWSKEKQTDKGRQYNCRPLSDCFSLEYFIVDLCLFVFLETMVLSTFVCLFFFRPFYCRPSIQWSKEKQTDKGRQYNGLEKNKQTKVDNIMV
jgi:hypothetical protein